MTDNTSDATRFAREQQSRTTAIGMNVFRPIVHFQVTMLRMWADAIERFAGNYEKGVEETAAAMKERPERAA